MRIRVAGRVVRITSVTVLLGLVGAYVLVPLVWVFVSTTKNGQQLVTTPAYALPVPLMLRQNLEGLFRGGHGIFVYWLANSIGYALVISVGSTYLAALAGYALAKLAFAGRRAFGAVVIVSLMVPTTVLVIPLFILESRMHLTNSYQGVILPQLLSAFSVFFMMIYVDEALPDALIDAAQMDGAGHVRIFHQVALPMARPGLVTLVLISFIGAWNNYFLPLVLLSSQKLFPVTVGLAGGGTAAITGTAVSVLPTLVMFPILQRYVARGLSLGAAADA